MITKIYKFTLSTSKIGSEVSEIVELQFYDDDTEQDIEEQVTQTYIEWVAEKNYGGFVEVK